MTALSLSTTNPFTIPMEIPQEDEGKSITVQTANEIELNPLSPTGELRKTEALTSVVTVGTAIASTIWMGAKPSAVVTTLGLAGTSILLEYLGKTTTRCSRGLTAAAMTLVTGLSTTGTPGVGTAIRVAAVAATGGVFLATTTVADETDESRIAGVSDFSRAGRIAGISNFSIAALITGTALAETVLEGTNGGSVANYLTALKIITGICTIGPVVHQRVQAMIKANTLFGVIGAAVPFVTAEKIVRVEDGKESPPLARIVSKVALLAFLTYTTTLSTMLELSFRIIQKAELITPRSPLGIATNVMMIELLVSIAKLVKQWQSNGSVCSSNSPANSSEVIEVGDLETQAREEKTISV